jgi:hypothetical protein
MVTRAAVMATGTMWAMATVMRLAGKEKRKDESSKGEFQGDQDGGH